MATKTIAIIGAGPVGLAAAADATERGLIPIVLERGPAAGHAIRQWAHVPMFSPWAFNIDKAAERLLEASGWTRPDPDRYPTGGDLISHYVAPLAERLRDRIKLNAEVISVSRAGFDKVKTDGREAVLLLVRYRDGGTPASLAVDAVIDASGTWFSPNPAGVGGLPAIGEIEATEHIAYGMPDISGEARSRYAGKQVAVLGGGHSAIGTLIALSELQAENPATKITWLYRGPILAKAFGGGAADQLSARGELGLQIADLVKQGRIRTHTGFRLEQIERDASGLRLISNDERKQAVTVDELIVATGFRPELALLRELRVELDPALECPPSLAPLIDPNVHSCGTVRPHGAADLAHPEPGFYIAGMKSYGRAPTFLLATGHEQVRSIVAELAGDHAAARRVELVLPETGVCSATPGGPSASTSSCCGGPAPVAVDACCADDAVAKQSGKAGCGCSSSSRETTRETAEV